MSRFVPFVACGLLVGLGAMAALVFWAPPGPLAPTPRSAQPLVSTTPQGAAPAKIPDSQAGPQASPGDLSAALDGFLGAVPVTPVPSPREVLDAALRQGQAPLDYRKSLEDSMQRRRGARLAAVKLLAEGLGGAGAKLRFQHALALAKHLDGPMTEALLEGIKEGEERARPDLVFALRGTREARVGEALADLYSGDEDPKVRAQAAYVLGEGGESWPPLAVERARTGARLDLQSEDPILLKAAGDVLGIPPLSAPDRELLVRTLKERGPSPKRLTALRALAAAKVPAATLAPTLEQIADDAGTNPELRAQVKSLLDELQRPK